MIIVWQKLPMDIGNYYLAAWYRPNILALNTENPILHDFLMALVLFHELGHVLIHYLFQKTGRSNMIHDNYDKVNLTLFSNHCHKKLVAYMTKAGK